MKIHDYTGKDNFVIRIATDSDDIVLAKVPPSATLLDTLQEVRRRIDESNYQRTAVENRDTLIVPKINFGVDRAYSEMTGRNIVDTVLILFQADQTIRFMLNESGARLISKAQVGAWLADDGSEDPQEPRDMQLDRPFLLFLQERTDSEPYLVLWIGNDELLEKAEM